MNTVDGLTEQEMKVLRTFQRQVERLRGSSIVRQGKLTLKKTFGIDLATGEKTLTFSGYDPELFQAQLPLIRQFVLQQDQINFIRVCNLILRRCQRQVLKEWTTEAKRLWNESFRRVPEVNDQMLFGVTASLEESLDKLFYGFGGLFHANIDESDEESSVAAVKEALIHSEFPYLLRCLNIVDSVIWWWLDETTATVPTVDEIRLKDAAKESGTD